MDDAWWHASKILQYEHASRSHATTGSYLGYFWLYFRTYVQGCFSGGHVFTCFVILVSSGTLK